MTRAKTEPLTEPMTGVRTGTLTEQLAGWASAVTLDAVPTRVVELAKSQVLSQLGSMSAAINHPLGRAVERLFGSPAQPNPVRSACAQAGLTSCLHFDDAAYTGQLSTSCVSVALAYARSRRLDGESLLAALIAANECAARVGAAATLGSFRGQTAIHTHVVGAIAARLHSERAPAGRWVHAMGIALTMPPMPLLHGFLSSDAKALTAATSVRSGLDSCDAARHGLCGPVDILEHRDGFLARFAAVPLGDAVTAALGKRWHTDTLSFKKHPCAPVLDTAVECAARLHDDLRGLDHGQPGRQIIEIEVMTSQYTMLVEKPATAYLAGPNSPAGALVFSMAYAVATTLLTGGLTVGDFTAIGQSDPARWELAARVRVRADHQMTRDALLSDVPFGQALREAGSRAPEWLDSVGGADLAALLGPLSAPLDTFETAVKTNPARVTVHLADGTTLSRECRSAPGAPGTPDRDQHRTLVTEKYLAVGGSRNVVDAVNRLESLTPREVRTFTDTALALRPAAAEIHRGGRWCRPRPATH